MRLSTPRAMQDPLVRLMSVVTLTVVAIACKDSRKAEDVTAPSGSATVVADDGRVIICEDGVYSKEAPTAGGHLRGYATHVMGIDADLFARTICAAAPTFRSCFDALDPSATQRSAWHTISVGSNALGEVTFARSEGGIMGESSLASCVTDAAGRLKFPSMPSGGSGLYHFQYDREPPKELGRVDVSIVSGAVPVASIRRILRAALPRLHRCYEATSWRRVDVRLVFDRVGNVTSATSDGARGTDLACALAVFPTLGFPPPDSEGATIVATIE